MAARSDFVQLLKSCPFVSNADLEIRWITEKFSDAQSIEAAVQRRLTGEPLAYILGERGFYKHLFVVTPAVLIPRPETELLVELAVAHARANPAAEIRVLDMGSGSGCIGLSVAAELPAAQITLVDKSPEALQVAKINAERLELSQRTDFVEGDLNLGSEFSDLPSQTFDIVLANPPYIDPADTNKDAHALLFEPSMALYAEEKGFKSIRAWLDIGKRVVKSGGLIAFEIGSEQGAQVQNMFMAANCFKSCTVVKDLAGHDRVVMGVRG